MGVGGGTREELWWEGALHTLGTVRRPVAQGHRAPGRQTSRKGSRGEGCALKKASEAAE